MRWKISIWDRNEWHRWFAWHPVHINGEMVWLEHVERRHEPGWSADIGFWEYRELKCANN